MTRNPDTASADRQIVAAVPPVSHPDSRVRAMDRIAFTLLLALAVHFLVWAGLGVSLPQLQEQRLSSTLHVTLSKVPSEPVTEPVKRIAEQDQQASGRSDREQEPQQQSAPPPAVPAPPEAKPEPESKPEQSAADKPAVNANVTPAPDKQKAPAEKAAVVEPAAKNETEEAAPEINSLSDAQALLARSLEIARLEAQQQALAEQYAKRPRVRTISTLTAKASDDAFYLRQWQEKIERVGNLNYPERIRRENLTGRLRMLVALKPDGSVKEAQILKSSGHPVLDQAALEIVRLSAPFAPFPRSIRERTDILEIIRTWQFGNGNLFSETG